jgi:hypothetical protein
MHPPSPRASRIMVFDIYIYIYSPQHNLVQIIEIKVQSIDSVRKRTITIRSLSTSPCMPLKSKSKLFYAKSHSSQRICCFLLYNLDMNLGFFFFF